MCACSPLVAAPAAMLLQSLLLVATATSAPGSAGSAVIVLSGGKFDEVLAAHSTLLVGFFAPWCTHCNQMAQAWEGAASSLLNSTPPVRVASVNGAVETKLARRFGVETFPAIKLFHDGDPAVSFSGERTKAALIEFAVRSAKPTVHSLRDVRALVRLLRVRPAIVLSLASLAAPESTRSIDAFHAALKAAVVLTHPRVAFAMPRDAAAAAAIAAKLGVNPASGDVPPLLMLRHPASSAWKARDVATLVESVYNGDHSSAAAIGAWVALERHPLVYTFDDAVAERLYGEPNMHASATPSHLLLFGDLAARAPPPRSFAALNASAALQRSFAELCERVRGELLCVFVPSTEERVLQQFGVNAARLPAAVVLRFAPHGMLTYRAPRDSAAALAPWGLFDDDDDGDGECSSSSSSSDAEGCDAAAAAGAVDGLLWEDGEGATSAPQLEGEAEVAAALQRFADDYTRGALRPHLRSEDPHDAARAAGRERFPEIATVVGRTFESAVLDAQSAGTVVLLTIYAPWCGHCKALRPTLAAVAAHYADDARVLVAELDGVANELDHAALKVEGFPTVALFAGSGAPCVTYDGARDFESLVALVESGRASLRQ